MQSNLAPNKNPWWVIHHVDGTQAPWWEYVVFIYVVLFWGGFMGAALGLFIKAVINA